MDYSLTFRQKAPGASQPTAPGTIAVWPRDRKWDDFGYNFRANIEIMKAGASEPLQCPAFLIPDQESGDPLALRKSAAAYLELAERSGAADHPLAWRPRGFFLLLASVGEYDKLVRYLGSQQEARQLLRPLNDLVTLQEDDGFADTIRAVSRTEAFTHGVLRNAMAYKAFYRGNRLLREGVAEPAIDALRPFTFTCRLAGFAGAAHRLDVKFLENDRFPERAQCLIGANGSGKTRLLNELATTLRSARVNDPPEASGTPEPRFAGTPFERILAFSFDGSDAFHQDVAGGGSVDYFAFDLRTKRANELDRSTTSYGTTRLLVDILRATELFEDAWLEGSRFDVLQDALSGFLPFDDLCLPLSSEAQDYHVKTDPEGRKWISVNDIRSLNEKRALSLLGSVDEARDVTTLSEESAPVRLSSGQQMYLRFAVHFLSFIERATLVLIDEPETHLHPNLISGFMVMLRSVLERTRSLALVATHSPFLVREVAREAVHIYTVGSDQTIKVLQPTLKTLGASVDEISDAVFGDYTARKYIDVVMDALVAEGPASENAIAQYRRKLNPAVLSRIALRSTVGGEK